MKKTLFLAIIIFILAGISQAMASDALTLSDCYALALKQSELIAIDAERLIEAEGHFLQAFGEILPHVSFSSSDLASRGSGATTSNHERKFVFSQLIFSGFKEFAAISGSRLEHEQREREKLRAEQLLFLDVSDSFYLLLEVKEDLKALDVIKQALKSRIKELDAREKLGRSRRSEVVNTEAQLYGIEAEYELVKRQEILVRQLLEFLIGKSVGKIIDDRPLITLMQSEDFYVSKAVMRPDVQALQKAYDIAKKLVIVARSDFFPHVDLEYNNYLGGRTLAGLDTNWDLTLNVDVPIFKGTETWGAVKSANSQSHQAELKLRHIIRVAKVEIRDSYVRLDSSILRYIALKKALSAAQMNYILQNKDYRYNLVNNIDVLQAIQTWHDAKRNSIRGFYEAKRSYWRLRVSTGESLL